MDLVGIAEKTFVEVGVAVSALCRVLDHVLDHSLNGMLEHDKNLVVWLEVVVGSLYCL